MVEGIRLIHPHSTRLNQSCASFMMPPLSLMQGVGMSWQASAGILFCAILAGCGTPRASWFPSHPPKSVVPVSGTLDFNWSLSGNRQAGPMQVFSDGAQTWLQWRPNQAVPAIVVVNDGVQSVVSYRRMGQYTIIDGVPHKLYFRAGHHVATASRTDAHLSNATDRPQRIHQAQPDDHAARPADKSQVAFSVSRQDMHLRQALGRWAGLSGWRFEPEHWSVDIDVPVSAAASFSDDFVESVQALLLATELSDRPLQPCFYANQVLRVIPLAEACDRTAVAQEAV